MKKKTSALLCGFMLVTTYMYAQPMTIASKEISPILVGAFFEDLNYAADGGLYGELLQNRSFEYTPSDIYDLRGTHQTMDGTVLLHGIFSVRPIL